MTDTQRDRDRDRDMCWGAHVTASICKKGLPGKTKSPPIPFSLKFGEPKIASSTSNTTGGSTSDAQFFAQPKWIGAEPNEYLYYELYIC